MFRTYGLRYLSEIVTKENLKVRPSKVVAGLEADKTNEFLQAIGKALERKLSSKEAVEAVNNGNTVSSPKENKAGRKNEEKVDAKASKTKTKNDKVIESSKKTVQNDRRPKPATKQAAKNESDPRKPKSKVLKNVSERNSIEKNDKTGEEVVPNEKSKQNAATNDRIELENPIELPDVSLSKITDDVKEATDSSHEMNHSLQERKESLNSDDVGNRSEDINGKVLDESTHEVTSKDLQTVSSDVIDTMPQKQERKSAKNKKEPIEELKALEAHSSEAPRKHEAAKPGEMPERKRSSLMKAAQSSSQETTTRPMTALRSATIRPASARPGAPRRRDRNVEIILQAEKFSTNIPESKPNANSFGVDLGDDGENLVVIDDNIIEDGITPSKINEALASIENAKEQGHLVQQILETQNAFAKTDVDGKLISDKKSEVRIQSNLKSLASLICSHRFIPNAGIRFKDLD